MNRILVATLSLFICTSLSAAWSQSTTPAPIQMQNKNTSPSSNGTIIDIISAGRDFTTAAQALQQADLAETLQNPGPFTIFIPNNAAFQKLPTDMLQSILHPESKDKLKSLLLFHIIRGKMMPNDLQPGKYKTMNGKEITITESNGQKKVNGANITKNGAIGKNGVIYVIDDVLLP